MTQPIRKGKKLQDPKKAKVGKVSEAVKKRRSHPKYGTSKLEDYFAENFLDALGVKYVRQFEAKDIGRFYDFKVEDGPIIEVNGSYWHGDKRIYEEKDLNRIQKRNIYVDKIKERWAREHCIPIYYVWEKDINDNPEKVMKVLKEAIGNYTEKQRKIRDKNRRH